MYTITKWTKWLRCFIKTLTHMPDLIIQNIFHKSKAKYYLIICCSPNGICKTKDLCQDPLPNTRIAMTCYDAKSLPNFCNILILDHLFHTGLQIYIFERF